MDTDANEIEKAKNTMNPTMLFLIMILAASILSPLISSLVLSHSIASTLASKTAPTKTVEPGKESETPAAEPQPEKQMVFYDPMEFLVNLADVQVNHYLRTTLSIGGVAAEGEKTEANGGREGKANSPQLLIFKKLRAQEPVVRDLVISIISAYTMEALVSTKGKNELKTAIQQRLRELVGDTSLTIYFTAFTLQ